MDRKILSLLKLNYLRHIDFLTFRDISYNMGASKIFVESAIKDSFFIDKLKDTRLDTEFANRLNYHRILVIEKGFGSLLVDENRFEINDQEIFLMAKGQLYVFDNPAIVSGFVLCFGDCFWDKAPSSASNCKAVLFNNATANQRLQLTSIELAEFNFLFEALNTEFGQPHYANQIDAMAAYLKIIMIKLANVKITDETTYDSQDYLLYRNFMDLLSNRYKENREVSDYAKTLSITPRRLSDVCKRCSSKSAKEIINGQLVAEAKRSLQFSSTPVKEIAYHLNFKSPEQFSHFFKKNTNFSPASYRDQFVNLGVQIN